MSQSTFADRTVLRILGEQGPSRTALITVWAWDDAVTKLQVLTAVKKLRDLGAIEVGPPDPRGEQTWQLSTHARNNPNWGAWKGEAQRRGRRAGVRAQRYSKAGYGHAKRGAKRGAKETARAARYSADYTVWAARDQAAAARIAALEQCATSLGFEQGRVPEPGAGVLLSAHSARGRNRTKKPQFANYNPTSFGTPHPTPISAAQLAIITVAAPDGTVLYVTEVREGGVTPLRSEALQLPRNVANIQADMVAMRLDAPTEVVVIGRTKSNPHESCGYCRGTGYAGPHGDTCARCEGSGSISVERCDICRKSVRGGTIETRSGEWACVSCHDKEEGVTRDRFGYRSRRNPQAKPNWAAAVGRIALQLAIPIATNVGQRRWGILMAMSVEERADWMLNTAKKTSWLGGPAGRIGFGVWPDKIQRKVFLEVAEAMTDPKVQQAALQAAGAGKAVYSSQKAAANPAPMVWEERIYQNGKLYNTLHFDTLDDFFRMIDGEDPQEGNEQVYANWKGGRGSAETWYVDGTDTRWTLKFRKVQDPRRRRRR